MDCKIDIIPRLLHLKQSAGASRGVYTARKVWYLHLTSSDYPGRAGIRECAPLPTLNCDGPPNCEDTLVKARRRLEDCREDSDVKSLHSCPSISFGLETAVWYFRIRNWAFYDTASSRGKAEVPVNGLIWMRDFGRILTRIEEKVAAGSRYIKLKIGAINLDEKLTLLRHICAHFSSREIELRMDVNGAFSPADVMEKLKRLSELDLYSIEQPVCTGQWKEVTRLASDSPSPIVLDEELIGCNTLEGKRKLLSAINPQYIVLRSSLHGGICGGNEWITEAEKQHVGWWITSALESNIDLNTIAQWCVTFDNPLPQGLGIGQLFTDNAEVPLEMRKDCLWFCNDNI